jgi:nucleoid DNA-binding protein
MNDKIFPSKLYKIVSQKLKGIIPVYHVRGVISILLEELRDELLETGEIKIGNFGDFHYQKLPDKRHVNISTKKMDITRGHRAVRFKLSKAISRILTSNLDIDKTFSETQTKEN